MLRGGERDARDMGEAVAGLVPAMNRTRRAPAPARVGAPNSKAGRVMSRDPLPCCPLRAVLLRDEAPVPSQPRSQACPWFMAAKAPAVRSKDLDNLGSRAP